MDTILITGAAGFIGSNFAQYYVHKKPNDNIIILDKLTYAGNLKNLDTIKDKITFIKGDICDFNLIIKLINENKVNKIVHFAAETHVDNSIKDPFIFTKTNVIGTHTLLEASRICWGENSNNKFIHVSTDEVYGSLGEEGFFTELSPIAPNSPYSASKASSDLIARAYFETYKLNINITRCSNNYGPNQHNEKLIPHMIKHALQNKQLPVYGKGLNIRDWLYVEDHCKAIYLVLENGIAGQVYNIGGHNEKSNIEIVRLILSYLGKSEDLISFVEDRKGHDFRYAIDPSKIKEDLNWFPETRFEDGIIKTINWYLDNKQYLES